jgi:hypothetical protein
VAKYGSFKYGSGQWYGEGSIAIASSGASAVSNPSRIIEGNPAYTNGVFSLSDRFFMQAILNLYQPRIRK